VRDRGTPSRIVAVGLSAAAAILLAVPPASASVGGITEYAIPTALSLPQGVTIGPDGAVWFAERTGDAIGRLGTGGAFSEFDVPTASAQPFWIATGPDGNLWFTERSANQIGRMTPAGAITEFAVPTAASQLAGIAAGPDGAMWFAEQAGSKIGRITTSGSITEFATPTTRSGPYAITAGPDGAMWFTEQGANKVGRISTSGQITEAAVSPGGLLSGIVAGPDGKLWFTERTGQSIVSITTNMATLAFYPLPSGGSPVGIAAGPDGRLWFAENTADRVGAIGTDGAIVEYALPSTGTQSFGIAGGPDAVWFTEQAGNRIGTMPIAIDTTAPTVDLTVPADGASFLVGDAVTAAYSCGDAGGSGLASCTGPVPSGIRIDTATTGTHAFTVTATDGAGNTASVTHTYTVSADETAPTVDVSSPADGAAFLVGTRVIAAYSCADQGGSGLDGCDGPVAPGDAIDTANQGPHDFTVTASDGAGNTASVTNTYTVFADETAPTVDVSSPADGASFLVGTRVVARYSCADEGGSGLASCDGPVAPGDAIDTASPGTHDFTVTASDGAGNRASVTRHYTVVADPIAPTVRLTTPADRSWFVAGASVRADYTCADDGGSGLTSCVGTTPNGSQIDTTVGPHTFDVTATDGAGNATTLSHGYLIFAGVGGTLANGKSQAGSALTLVLDLGAPSAQPARKPNAGQGRAVGSTSPTTVPSTQAVSCDDPSIVLGSPSPADVRAMSLDANNHLSLTWKTDRTWAGTCRALVVPIDAWGGATAFFPVRFS
jgi:virginiamycin B lyase